MKTAQHAGFLGFVLRIAPPAFTYSLLLYLILVLLENVFPGFVSNTMDLNIFLIPTIATGLVTVFAPDTPIHNKPSTKRDYLVGILIGLVGGILIYYKTRDLGMTSVTISILSSLLIIFMHILVLQNEPKQIKKSKRKK